MTLLKMLNAALIGKSFLFKDDSDLYIKFIVERSMQYVFYHGMHKPYHSKDSIMQ